MKALPVLFSVVLIAAAACAPAEERSSQQTTTNETTASSAGSATSPSVTALPDAGSFTGPIIAHCDANDPGPTISKLNLEIGFLVDIAKFPVGECVSGTSDQFTAQIYRTEFSPDFTKASDAHGGYLGEDARQQNGHVGYYDLTKKAVVDVTEIVGLPPTDDFSPEPKGHVLTGFPFTKDGLFQYADLDAGEFKLFDTKSMRVVRSSPGTAVFPGGLEVPRWVELTVGEVWEGMPPSRPWNYRTCNGVWAIEDGNRYLGLRDVDTPDGSRDVLALAPIPANPSGPCEEPTPATDLSPPTYVMSAGADPAGSTILFFVVGKDFTVNLYRASVDAPEHPTEVEIAGDPFGKYDTRGNDKVAIVDWS